MAKVDDKELATAIRQVRAMNQERKEALCEELRLAQPNLLASVLALTLSGNEPAHVDTLLHVLLVAHVALTNSGHTLQEITEQQQERELEKLVAIIKFSEGLSPDMVNESLEQYIGRQREPYLFAYVIHVLRESRMLEGAREESKYLAMVALNIVGCIANAEPLQKPPGTVTRRNDKERH